MADRTGWIKDKVTHSLGVTESMFNELLERQGPDGKTYWESLSAFLDHEDETESVAMFYTHEEVVGGPEGRPLIRTQRTNSQMLLLAPRSMAAACHVLSGC
jgi:hypothetical protein